MCQGMWRCAVPLNRNLYFWLFIFIFKWVFSVACGHATEPICMGSKSVVLALMSCARQKSMATKAE